MKKLIWLIFLIGTCSFSSLIHAQTLLQSNREYLYVLTEEKAKEIVEKSLKASPVIDGHNDLFIHYFDCKNCPRELKDYRIDTINTGHTDIPRLRKGAVGGLLLNVFGSVRTIDSYLQAWDLLYRMEQVYSNDIKIAGNSTEMKNIMKQGKIAILPTLEGAIRLENNMYLLRSYYKLGLRSVTFAYRTNQLADGSDDTTKYNGISTFGKAMVQEMNRLGIIIDMSHISTKAMSDILDITKAPVIFSHSNVRTICDVNRNVPDDILIRLKQNKGLIMLTPVPYFTKNEHNLWMNERDILGNTLYTRFMQNPQDSTELDRLHNQWIINNPEPIVTIADLANHFDFVKKLIGAEHIGIAGDYDGIEFLIKGMEDVSSFPLLLTELARRGWTERELRQVTGENFLRVFKEVENISSQLKNEFHPSLVTDESKKN